MIHDIYSSEQTRKTFLRAFSDLELSKILRQCGIRKSKGIPVKLVYVKNRNKKQDWLLILSTDCSLSNEEIVRIYGNRWS